MTEDEIIHFVAGLGQVDVMTASRESGAPEIAWGDSFFLYDPDGRARERSGFTPFATLVTKDYPGFDSDCDLDRPGVFRVNIAVGRALFEEVVGHTPAAHAGHREGLDYTGLDRLLPHPVYAAQGWVAVLNPGSRTSERVCELLSLARDRAAARHRPPER
ncbi:DUF6194 family protein [Nocardiopsis metallicus]|uniref:DUF6194 domain-containing protein n=1 Tax=Nocardiopsis metallicus TaxID=179819 RepID=A0A840WE48_9ACTN|nr:DUF6194 family protein [Nocardiopsis metallicus]MBB5490235.1 hypothetical protein [Nocardiopsis metallicus]